MNLNKFLDIRNKIAIVGVSSNHDKWGWKLYKKLKHVGFNIYPVNPKYNEIDGDICYPSLSALPKKPVVVITVVPPKITEKVAEECKTLGIKKIWMQPGSETEKSIAFCENNNIEVIYNVCFAVDGLKKEFGETR